jgi:hypothetical protein
MSYATGANADLAYVMESTWGTTPDSPSMKRLRFTGESVRASIAGLPSAEIRSDRMIPALTQGNIDVSGSIEFEFSHNSFDDLLEAAFFGSWDNAAITASTIAFVSGSPAAITDSGNGFVTAGFKVGNLIKVTGSASNNGYYTVAIAAAGTLTLATGETLTNESAGVPVTIKSSELKAGTTDKFFTMEKRFTDIGQYLNFIGCMINGLTLRIDPNAMVTGSFDIFGKDHSASGASLGTPADVASTTPFNSFNGTLYEGGSSIAIVTSLEIRLANNIAGRWAVGADNAKAAYFEGRSNCTGTLSAFFQDLTLYNKFLNGTTSSLKVILGNGTNRTALIIPNIKYSGEATPVIRGENDLALNLSFQALRDPTEATSLKICRYVPV